MPLENNNGWGEWSKYVLKELERLNENYNSLSDKLDKLNVDLVTLKVKAGIWGAIAGSIPVVIGLIISAIALLI
jgi:hypothetical protein